MHLVDKTQINIALQKLGKKPSDNSQLATYLQALKDFNGIEIKTLDDIAALHDEIERMIFKYQDMFPPVEVKEGSGIMELFYLYCSIMEVSPDYTKMTLREFAALKKLAEARSKEMQKQIDNGRNR